jgi:hypothetical protein
MLGRMSVPRVVAAAEVALVWEGLEIGPLSVEFWGTELVVRAASMPVTEEARIREEAFRVERYSWMSEVARSRSSRALTARGNRAGHGCRATTTPSCERGRDHGDSLH